MKETARRLLPSFFWRLARCMRNASFNIRDTYSGIYASFKDVPGGLSGYDDNQWPIIAERYSRWAISRNESGFIPAAVTNESALLPMLVSVSGATRILDFGGAMGFSYIATKYAVTQSVDRYVIIEHPNVCANGREFFKGDPRVQFLERIPAEEFDVVLIGSSLQYIENYPDLLRRLASLNPRWILFTKTPAGECKTFVSAQVNLPGKIYPTWLFNARELVSFMQTLNYNLVFRGAIEGEVNQKEREIEYKLQSFSNMLFEIGGVDNKMLSKTATNF